MASSHSLINCFDIQLGKASCPVKTPSLVSSPLKMMLASHNMRKRSLRELFFCGFSLSFVNNNFNGTILDLKILLGGFTFYGNSFYESMPMFSCALEVTTLLGFLASLNYPIDLSGSWTGNNQCNFWIGIT